MDDREKISRIREILGIARARAAAAAALDRRPERPVPTYAVKRRALLASIESKRCFPGADHQIAMFLAPLGVASPAGLTTEELEDLLACLGEHIEALQNPCDWRHSPPAR